VEQVGPCFIIARFQTFVTTALSETLEVGHRTRAADCGGINRNENTVVIYDIFFYSVVSLKLNTELCTNTVQAINNEEYSYVETNFSTSNFVPCFRTSNSSSVTFIGLL